MSSTRTHVVNFIRAYRGEVLAEALPFANRRLAIYRRAMLQATQNEFSTSAKIARCRRPDSQQRWADAARAWNEVACYFEARARALNGGELI